MTLKVCLHPGCPRLSDRSRCPEHQALERRRLEARRGPRPWYGGEWQRLRSRVHGQPCAYCGAPADTADHVIPRSLAGGVVPACRVCNARKKNRRG